MSGRVERRGGFRLLILGALAVAALVAILMPVEPASRRSAVVVSGGEVGDPVSGAAR